MNEAPYIVNALFNAITFSLKTTINISYSHPTETFQLPFRLLLRPLANPLPPSLVKLSLVDAEERALEMNLRL